MDDLISRQAAIDAINSYMKKRIPVGTSSFQDGVVDGYARSVSILKWLPSAEPQRKKGKWTEKEVIHADEAKNIITEWQSCKCSVCGRYHTEPYMYYFNEPRFCSWCGAEMKGGDEE